MSRESKYLGVECSVDGCSREGRYVATGFCNAHHIEAWRRSRGVRTNAEAHAARMVNTGEVSYKQAHTRVRRHRGNASEYKCVDCGAVAQHWSYTHNATDEQTDGERVWSPNDQDYMPRCVSHHKRFDLKWREDNASE